MKLFKFGSNDLGIDLGTSNILVALKDNGIVLKEPSAIAINRKTGEVISIGSSAKEMIRKNSRKYLCSKTIKRRSNFRFNSNSINAKKCN